MIKDLQSLTPEIKRILERINDNPKDKDLYFDLAIEAINAKNYELAIKTLLSVKYYFYFRLLKWIRIGLTRRLRKS